MNCDSFVGYLHYPRQSDFFMPTRTPATTSSPHLPDGFAAITGFAK